MPVNEGTKEGIVSKDPSFCRKACRNISRFLKEAPWKPRCTFSYQEGWRYRIHKTVTETLSAKNTHISKYLYTLFFPVEVELDNFMLSDFLSEVTVMRKFDHKNVIKLVGVTLLDNKPCIILPLMVTNLKQHLKYNRLVFCFMCSFCVIVKIVMHCGHPKIKSCLQILSETELQLFCLGAACGMEYLATQNIVHRDIAARNCM